jgi:CHAD domain-containing protein
MTMLRTEREIRRRNLLAAVGEARYVDLLERMVEAANEPCLMPPAKRPSREALPELARAPFERLRQTVVELPEEPDDADLHRIRIRAKRVRYAAEAVAPVVGKRAVLFARAAARLQDTLGELQDAALAHAWLASAAHHHPAVAFVAGELAGFELIRAQEARNRWPEAWQKLARKKLRSWM